MSVAFNVVLEILLLGSLLLFIVGLLATAFTETNRLERFLRIAAIFAGAMVAVGAASSGLDYATYTVNVLSQARSASAFVHVATTIVPAALGSGIGFYLVRAIRRSETFAIRIFGFVGMLATTAFIEVYAEAATRHGFKLGAAALPNIGFTAGVILTVVFTLRTDDSGHHSSALDSVASLLRRRAARSGSAPPSSSQAFVPSEDQLPGPSGRRDFRGL
jgi:hypothetical protein